MPRLITSLENFPHELRGCGVAIGNFDAVHRGHASLLGHLVQQSQAIPGPSVVFTFDPPPETILRPEQAPAKPLTTLSRRAELMGKLGIDAVIAFPTTRQFLQYSAEEFFGAVVVQALGAKAMMEGPNFRFGNERRGDIQMLQGLCQRAGIHLSVVTPQVLGDSWISSTRIRQLISQGNMVEANQMLVEPHRIRGTVTTGAQRGRQIGFPTANLSAIPVLTPCPGVYAGRALLHDGFHPAAIHIGSNPTFADQTLKVEVHIIQWTGDLYDRELEVEILSEIRGVKKFSSANELIEQLHQDIAKCAEIAAKAV